LPDEELAKRLKVAPEDVSRAQPSFGSKRSLTIQGSGPLFRQSSGAMYQKAVSSPKASALSIVSAVCMNDVQIADSKEVEVLVLRTNILSYLPEPEKDKIYEDIARLQEPDKPASVTEIVQRKADERKWDGFRTRLVQDIRKVQYMDRHRGVYKR
jgi:hypothetical protein